MSFDWTGYILYNQVAALKGELDKIDIPIMHEVIDSAIGPAVTFNNVLPNVKTLLSSYDSFSKSIDFLEAYQRDMITATTSQLRADVGVLLQTLEAFIKATYPPEEKKQIGFV